MTAAAIMVAEAGDVRRFAHPRGFMGFLGLVPKECHRSLENQPPVVTSKPATLRVCGS
jgi:hypothetical protein